MNRRREHAGYQEASVQPRFPGRLADAFAAAALGLGLAAALVPAEANGAVTLRSQCLAAAPAQSSPPGTAEGQSSDISVYTPGGSSGTAASPEPADQAAASAQPPPCTAPSQ